MMPRPPRLSSYPDVVVAQRIPGPARAVHQVPDAPQGTRHRELVRYGLMCAKGVTVRNDEQRRDIRRWRTAGHLGG